MLGVVHAWLVAVDPRNRHKLMGVAGYCVGEYGGRSPIGRAIRQVIFSKAARPDDEDMDTGEWLAWCDRIVAAMPLIPFRTLCAVYTVAAILERIMPRDSAAEGWESLASQRECWAALRRSIDEHASTLPAGYVVREWTPEDEPEDIGEPGDEDIDNILNAIIVMVSSARPVRPATPADVEQEECDCDACRADRAAGRPPGTTTAKRAAEASGLLAEIIRAGRAEADGPFPGISATIRAMAEADARAAEAEVRFKVGAADRPRAEAEAEARDLLARAEAAVEDDITRPGGPAKPAGPAGIS